ncbi:Zinc finger protein ZPR1 [Wickerhamiella sorbophila]|uniref:Zinc finger protein ZPR1 n=1 Tax=Wickerhamiella sorbophila TaxID=45607 RepID=A0A2T0FDL5_9ASCO|nr:Zinc finger protein ZPR1 [Wickerhamiella sorbophila]PRT53094.1 Zinc finger protein ZPR1 [Wickerhamiella sorbophila]
MSDHTGPDSDPKKPKLNEDEVFSTIGSQAEAVEQQEGVEYISSDSLRKTGATDAAGRPVQEVDSLCMNCHQQGVTRLLFTAIPRFREVVVMSFECPHCGFKSSEVQAAAEIQVKGVEITFKLDTPHDLSRQVVKTEYATCKFHELDIEIPPGPGRLTTIEGLLSGMKDDLEQDQPVRLHVDPDMHAKIQTVLDKLAQAANGEILPLTFVLDDPSGNSFVEYEPQEHGNKWVAKEYVRTAAQDRALGMAAPEEEEHRNESVADKINTGEFDEGISEELRNEVQTIQGACPSCHHPTDTHMKVVNIPHFKDVIIMSTVCHECGYKSNEVKTGGAVPEKGRRIRLNVLEKEDLSRDILKSETCSLRFPELELDLSPGTLGGRFTTVEGLLRQVYEELESKVVSADADSMTVETKQRWAAFLARLDAAVEGQLKFTIVMEDPLAASYIQNVYAPDADPEMVIEDYERTHDENEELGLNDIQV